MVLGRTGPKDREARYDSSESTGGVSMRAVIIYESMFGNTHAIADAIAKGLEPLDNVVVVPVVEAGRERLGDADLLVVGGPTHFHGMSRPAPASGRPPLRKSPRTIWCSIATPKAQACVTGSGRWATATQRLLPSTPALRVRRFSEGGRRRQSAENFGSTGSRWWPSPRASSSPWRITSNRARRPEPKNGVNGSRQEFYRMTSPMGTVRDDHPRPRRRDGRGNDPHPG